MAGRSLAWDGKTAMRRGIDSARRRIMFMGRGRYAGFVARDLAWRLAEQAGQTRALVTAAQRRLAADERGWLFVLGVNNSGTTLLSEILGRHPDVRAMPSEGHHLTNGLPRPGDHAVIRNWTTRPEVFRRTELDHLTAEKALYDWSFFFEPGRGYLLEKSPPNTIRALWMQEHFRPATFVALARHPYAVCEGIARKSGLPLATAARHWSAAYAWLLDDWSMLQRATLVRYEELCLDPPRVLSQVHEFLGLATPGTEAHQRFRIHGVESEIRSMNPQSIGTLSDDELRGIDEVAGDVMARLGYRTLAEGAREREWDTMPPASPT